MAEAEKGGRTAEANSSPGRYFARLSPTHACRKAVGRPNGLSGLSCLSPVCPVCPVALPAASLTASGQPASASAFARPRPPLHGTRRWRVVGLRGSAESRSKEVPSPSSSSPSSPSLLCFVPHAARAHRLPLPAAIRPCQPYHWPGKLANRSPNVDRSHTLTLTPAEALPRLPALTYRRPLLHRIASGRAGVPGARHLTARNVSFSPWGIDLRAQQACSGASDANSRARADKAETNTAIHPWDWSLRHITTHLVFCDCMCFF